MSPTRVGWGAVIIPSPGGEVQGTTLRWRVLASGDVLYIVYNAKLVGSNFSSDNTGDPSGGWRFNVDGSMDRIFHAASGSTWIDANWTVTATS